MKYEKIICSDIDTVKKYLSSLIEKKHDIFAEENSVSGKVKNNKLVIYVITHNRFPSGFVFHGKISEQNASTKISGIFCVPVFPILAYVIIFGIAIYTYNSISLYTLLPFLIVLLILIFDLMISHKQKNIIIDFLDEVADKLSKF